MDLKKHIREVPDFPKPGILFYDISTLLEHAEAWRATIDRLSEAVTAQAPDVLVGIESRGFLLSAPLAYKLNLGFTMARKEGKLPAETISHTYELEYGTDTVEIHSDAIRPGQKVVVVDDLLATGGTMAATIALLRKMGADVCGAAFIIELNFLKGRDRLDVPVTSLVAYDA